MAWTVDGEELHVYSLNMYIYIYTLYYVMYTVYMYIYCMHIISVRYVNIYI